MKEEDYGPNGGLIFAMQYLMENMDWFEEQVQDYNDDYLIIDCPGQIELYTHVELMKDFASQMQHWGYRLCVVYVIDSHFLGDVSKFISASMMCLSAMIRLELPHINIISKMDLIERHEDDWLELEEFFTPDFTSLTDQLNTSMSKKFFKLNKAISSLLQQWSMVHFVPLDKTDPDSVTFLLAQIDNALQYGEDEEPQEPNDMSEEEEEMDKVDEDDEHLSNNNFE